MNAISWSMPSSWLQHDRHGADAGLAGQRRLDFAQLDPEAADLHLVVGAPEALHPAVGVDARQVAGAVQARIVGWLQAHGLAQKFLRGQVRPAQIAGGDAGTDDAQLADRAARQESQVVLQMDGSMISRP